MSAITAFFARWRVRLGYPLVIVVLFFARPTPRSILAGALVGAIGLWLRAFAAGYLHKQEVLTVTGPYARSGFIRLFRAVLLRRHAARREGASSSSRGCLRRVRASCSAFHPASDRRETGWRLGRFLLFRSIQEES